MIKRSQEDTLIAQEIAFRLVEFMKKLEKVMLQPHLATQEDGIQLLTETNELIAKIEKLEYQDDYTKDLYQKILLAKHSISKALMTTPGQDGGTH